jgi:hypothetical protein
MKAWETDDYNSETGEYITDNRKRKMAEFLTRYRDNLGDFDYEGSAFKNADDLKGRLNKAISALNDGSDFSDELGALGFGERFRSNMFRTKNELYKGDFINGKRTKHPTYYENVVEPIVSKEKWENCQYQKQRNASIYLCSTEELAKSCAKEASVFAMELVKKLKNN